MAILGLGSSIAFAVGSSGITYQGRILKPNGQPMESSSVQFVLQIRTPDAGNCLMYEETQTLDMTNSKGLFSLTINDGSGIVTNLAPHTYNIDRVFANKDNFTFDPTRCSSGSAYTPNSADGRILVVSFVDSTMGAPEVMPRQTINFVPMAIEAKQIAGFTADSLLRFAEADGTLVNTSPLDNVAYTELLALLAGTSTQFEHSGRLAGSPMPGVALTNGQVLGWSGGAWAGVDPIAGVQAFAKTALPVCGVNEFLKDNGSGLLTCVVAANSGGTVTQVNTGTGLTGGGFTTTGTISIAAGGVGTTELANNAVTTGKILDGTITGADLATNIAISTTGAITTTANVGAADVNASGNITATGNVSGANVIATNVSSTINATRELQLVDPDDPAVTAKRVKMVAPLAIAADYTLTWPLDDGTSNQVLSTDGAGILSWTSFPSTASMIVQDGNTFAAPMTIGTNDAQPLNLETGGTTKVTVLDNGNVGIGTTTPSGRLSVVAGGDGFGASFRGLSNSNQVQIGTSSGIPTIGATNNAGNAWTDLFLNPGGNVYTGGSFSVGTSNFNQTLNVAGNSIVYGKSYIQGDNASTEPDQIHIQGNANPSKTLLIGLNTTGNYGVIQTDISGTKGTLALNPDGGNVGIGTAAPARLLEVAGPIRISPTALPGSAAAGDIAIDSAAANALKWYNGAAWQTIGSGNGDALTSNPLSQFAATTSAQLAGVLSDETGTGLSVFATTPTFTTNITSPLVIGGTGTTSTLTYKTTTGVGAAGADHIFQVGNNGATEAMRVLNNGNVGIGTATPVYRLHVDDNQTNPAASTYASIRGREYPTLTSANASNFYGVYGSVSPSLTAAGSTNNNMASYYGDATVNIAGNAGSIGTLAGADIAYGIQPAGGGTIINAYGLRLRPAHQAGAITNSYGIRIEAPLTGGAVTSEYGLYAASTTAKNYFAGNVGIGTTSPIRLLEVAGPIRISPTALPGSAAAGDIAIDSAAANALKWYNGTAWQTIGSGSGDALTTNPLSQFAATTSAQLAGVLSDETGTGLSVFNTAPTFATNITSPMIVGGTGTTSTLIHKTTTGVGAAGADQIFQVGNNGATEAMRILNSGNVGIGTAAPAALLDMVGNTTSNNGVQRVINNASAAWIPTQSQFAPNMTGGQSVFYQLGQGSSNYNSASVNFDYVSNGSPSNRLGFYLFGTTELMSIQGSGNVGIGTTSPNRLLEVAGPIRISPAALPGSAAAGDIAIDSGAANGLKYYNGTAWVALGSGSGDALTANPLSQFAATTSAQLAGVLSDETGTGLAVFATAPTFTTNVTSPKIIGGTGTTSTLTYQTTTGVGAAGADHIFKVGNNGATEAMRILNNGNIGIGTASPTAGFQVHNQNIKLSDSSGYGIDFFGQAAFGGSTDLPATMANIAGGKNLFINAGPTVGNTLALSYLNGSGQMSAAEVSTVGSGYSKLILMKSGGNVGIGTTTPNRLLEVAGPIRIAPTALPGSAGAGDIAIDSGAANGLKYYNGTAWVALGSGSGDALVANPLSQFAATTSAQLAGVLSDETGSGLAVFATAPTFTTNITSPMVVGGTGTTSTLTYKTTTGVGAAGADHVFQVGNNGATEAMRILNNGNVGIGTTNPSSNLHISAPSGDTMVMLDSYVNTPTYIGRFARGTVGSPTSALTGDILAMFGGRGYATSGFSTMTTGSMQVKAAETITATNKGTNLTFETTPLGSITAAERMRIDYAGNVGIGTTSPNRKLEVAGPIRISPAALPGSAAAGDIAIDSGAANGLKYYNGTAWVALGSGSGDALVANPLSQFAATTSAQLAGVLSDETGTGLAVFGTAPTFTTNITSPKIIGGTGTTSTLTYQTTTGVGAAGADHIFKVGNNGATEAMRILNNGNVGIGTSAPGTYNKLETAGGGIAMTDSQPFTVGYVGTNTNASGAVGLQLFNNGTDSGGFVLGGTTYGLYPGSAQLFGSKSVAIYSDSGVASGGTNPIIFQTGGSNISNERMRITSAGNVGIGTTTPATALDVNGAITTSGYILATGMITGSRFEIGTNSAAPVNGMFRANANQLSLSTASTERLRIDSSGNIGIGTTSPNRLLEVAGPIRVSPAALPGTALAGDIAIDSGAANGLKYYNGTAWVALGSGSGDALVANPLSQFAATTSAQLAGVLSDETGTGLSVFATAPTFTTNITSPMIVGGTGTTSTLTYKTTTGVGASGADHIFKVGNNGATEAMRILNNGNVGIGTAAPVGILDVESSSANNGVTNNGFTSQLVIGSAVNHSSSPTAGIAFNIPYQSSTGKVSAGILAWKDNNVFGDSAGSLGLYTAPDGSAPQNRLTILSGGNVGIGSTAPGAKLDVSGAVNIGSGTGTAGTYILNFANSAALNSAASVAGIAGEVNNSGSGSVGGLNINAASSYAGTTAGVNGVAASIRNYSSNTITAANSFVAGSPTVGGAITTATGLTINQQKVAGVTTGYGINQASSTDINAFAGNVGIGTTSPSRLLHVAGPMRLTPAALPTGAAGDIAIDSGAANALKYYNGTAWVALGSGSGDALVANPLSQFAATTSAQLAGVLSDETGTGLAVFGTAPTFTTNITSPLVIGGTGTTSTLTYKTTTGVGAAGADHIFQVGNNGATEAMRILNSGNIGIGVSAPVDRLHVHGASAAATYVHVTNTSTGATATDGLQIGVDASQDNVIRSDENKAIRFITNSTEAFTIASSLRTGVSSTNPQARFEVGSGGIAHAADLNGSLFSVMGATVTDSITGASGTATNLAVNAFGPSTLASSNTAVTTTNAYNLYVGGAPIKGTNNTATNAIALGIGVSAVGAQANSYGLYVNSQTGATNNYAATFMNGNVGIGTASPGRLLEVAGPMRISPAALPTGATGDIAIDSGAANALKYYNGSAWQTVSTTGATNGSAVLLGGNATTSDMAIGTSSSQNLYFATNGGWNMQIDTAGNVGIPSSGTEKFKVAGTTLLSGNTTVSTVLTNNSASNDLLTASSSGSSTNAGLTYTGVKSSVTNTGPTSTNIAGYFSASGATNNYGLLVPNGYVGIGITTPSFGLHVRNEATLAIAMEAQNNTAGSGPGFIGRRARDSAGSPAAVQTGDTIAAFAGRAYHSTGWSAGSSASISMVASENFTSGARGTHLQFDTTAPTTNVRSPKMWLSGDGNLGVGAWPSARLLEVAGPMRLAPAALPGTAGAGDIAIDSGAANALKYYNGTAWVSLAGGGDFKADGTVAMTGNLRLGANTLSNDGSGNGISMDASGRTNFTGGNGTTAQQIYIRNNNMGTGSQSILNFSQQWQDGAQLINERVGTGDTTYLAFGTLIGNTMAERMRIHSDGNVGIGTTNPSQKLSVAGGHVRFSGADGSHHETEMIAYGNAGTGWQAPYLTLRRANGTAASPTYVQNAETLGTISFRNHSSNGGAGIVSYATQTHTGSVSGSDLNFVTVANGGNTSSTRMTISNGGNVGIGTTAPTALLDVRSSAAAATGLSVLNSSASGAAQMVGSNDTGAWGGLYIQGSGAGVNLADQTSLVASKGIVLISNDGVASGGTDMISFRTGGYNANQERMRIDSTGKVGIGTTTPFMNLDIWGSDSGVMARVQNNDSSVPQFPGFMAENFMGAAGAGLPGLKLVNFRGNIGAPLKVNAGDYLGEVGAFGSHTNGGYGTIQGTRILFVAQENFSAAAAGSYMTFDTTNIGGTTPAERMRISANGNVGIGMTSGGEKLEVSGNVKATSFISTSDIRLKKDIETVPGLDAIEKLTGVRWNWKDSGKPDMGVIAQDVEKVFPSAVVTDATTGYKAVKYSSLIAPLIQSTKELHGMCKDNGEAIRGLASEQKHMTERLNSVLEENAQLKKEVEALKAGQASMEKRLQAIEAALGSKK